MSSSKQITSLNTVIRAHHWFKSWRKCCETGVSMAYPMMRLLFVDDRVGDEDCELMREAGRSLLETLDPSHLHFNTWKHFIVSCARVSMAQKCDAQLSDFENMTFGSLVPSIGSTSLDRLHVHPRARLLRIELPQVARKLRCFLLWKEYQDVRSEVEMLLSDLDSAVKALSLSG